MGKRYKNILFLLVGLLLITSCDYARENTTRYEGYTDAATALFTKVTADVSSIDFKIQYARTFSIYLVSKD